MEGAFQHAPGDLPGSVGVIVSAALIMLMLANHAPHLLPRCSQ